MIIGIIGLLILWQVQGRIPIAGFTAWSYSAITGLCFILILGIFLDAAFFKTPGWVGVSERERWNIIRKGVNFILEPPIGGPKFLVSWRDRVFFSLWSFVSLLIYFGRRVWRKKTILPCPFTDPKKKLLG